MSTKTQTDDLDATSTTFTTQDTQTSLDSSLQPHSPLINEVVEKYSQVMWKRVISNMIEKTIDEYYKRGGFERSNSRATDVVQARAAIACALCERFRIIDVARGLRKNHATIIYYKNHHENNLKFWHGYKPMYNLALSVISSMPFIKGVSDGAMATPNTSWRAYFDEQRREASGGNKSELLKAQTQYDIYTAKSQLFDNLMSAIDEGMCPRDAVMDVIEEAVKTGVRRAK